MDDSEVVREGLALVLDNLLGMDVTQCGSADEALQLLRTSEVDLALVDARMPGRDGLWTLKKMKEHKPALPVVIISTFDTEDYVRGAIDAGASGYVLKEATTQQLNDAVETALSGRGIYLHPVVAEGMLRNSRPVESVSDSLTDREREVLTLLAAGATNDEIAGTLFLTEKTVKSHMTSIFRKLQVSNRTQAATKALREGLLTGG